MKALVGAGLLGFLAFMIWYLTLSAGDSEKYMVVQIAYGNPATKMIEMHTNVGIAMVAMDPVQDEQGKKKDLNDWVKEHFTMTDAAGKNISFERRNNSNVIKSHQVLGTPEFFIVSRLVPGVPYTLDYKPRAKGPKVFRYKFTAPAQPEKPSQVSFDLVR